MRCSACSEIVKPIVALDIDGTLGDYHGHFLQFAMEYLGLQPGPAVPMYGGKGQFGEWFCFAFNTDITTFRQIKLAYRQGGQKRSMPAFSDASNLAHKLKEAGAEVWVTTTRPYLRLDGIDPDTREWLRRNDIPYDGLLYDESKYSVLAANVDPDRVVSVLDDLPEQYDAAESAFGSDVPLLRRNQYNEKVHRPNKVSNLEAALDVISSRVAEWKERHA